MPTNSIMSVESGQEIGQWTVLSQAPSRVYSGSTERRWNCRCQCGIERAVFERNLRNGRSPRCVRCGHAPLFKGDEATIGVKRRRALRRYALGPCERCGKPGVDHHHKDDDVGNNARDNIAILCRRCHMEVDGRLAAFYEKARQSDYKVKPIKPCVICNQPARPPRKGLCPRCYNRQRYPKIKARVNEARRKAYRIKAV
jgi:hypothetical protein